jgi:hypothetical protein
VVHAGIIAFAFASVLQDAPHAYRCHPWLPEREAARMETSTASETRRQSHARFEASGTADRPAACTFAWRKGPFEAVAVYVDPVLDDRAASICETTNGIVARRNDLEGLSQALDRFARGEGLAVSIHEEPRDDPSTGLVAISFTLG